MELKIYYTDELILDFSELVNHFCIVKIKNWDQGIEIKSINDNFIEEHYTYKDAPGISLALLNNPKCVDWINKIPKQLLPKLLEYENIYQGLIFSLLWFLSRYQSAVDLFISNPFLMWLILYCVKEKEWDEKFIIDLFAAKRTKILKVCDFKSTKSFLKFINRIKFKQLSSEDFYLLNRIQDLPDFHLLNHLEYIDFKLIRLIVKYPTIMTSKLIKHYNEKWSWKKVNENFSDICRMADRLNIQNIVERIGRCKNLDELSNLHDRLVNKINKLEIDLLPSIDYPTPPILGTNDIIPITNSKELYLEGRFQRNCVYGYHEKILLKKYYVYKVLHPERATLGIEIINDNTQIDQIKLRLNNQVSNETLNIVTNWLLQKPE